MTSPERKAMEMALEVLRQTIGHSNQSQTRIDDAKHALVQALSQPEQEPVAWVYRGILHEFDPSDFATSKVTPLYTAPPSVETAVLAEREACAKECEGWTNADGDRCAEAIRARSEK